MATHKHAFFHIQIWQLSRLILNQATSYGKVCLY